jgi:Zn-dependent peptidase ImmA (M78 family)
VVTINERRPEKVQRIILAHELGHAWHDHRPTRDLRLQARQEKEADEHAVRLLVDRFAYAEAERLYGPSVGAVARELELPSRMVETLRDITRRGEWGSRCGFVA